MKRIAIHFFGHMRTYQATYKSFFNNFIQPNLSYASMFKKLKFNRVTNILWETDGSLNFT